MAYPGTVVFADREAASQDLILYVRVEKYRPVTLDDVVSHKDITSTSKQRGSDAGFVTKDASFS